MPWTVTFEAPIKFTSFTFNSVEEKKLINEKKHFNEKSVT